MLTKSISTSVLFFLKIVTTLSEASSENYSQQIPMKLHARLDPAEDAAHVKPGCSSCPYVQQCEMMVCGSIYVDGRMQLDFVAGCSLYCPLGPIECKLDENGLLRWQPVDPCEVPTTTATTTMTTTTTTTTTNTVATTTTTTTTAVIVAEESTTVFPGSLAPSTNTETGSSSSWNEVSSSHDSQTSTSLSADMDYSQTNNGTTFIHWTDKPNKPISRWVLVWLIPLLAVLGIVLCFLACCLTMNHFKRTRDKVRLPPGKNNHHDDHYDELVLNTVGSSVSGHQRNRSAYTPGILSKTSENRPINNGQHDKVKSNGNLSGKRSRIVGYQRNGQKLQKSRRKLTGGQSTGEKKMINWQDVGTEEYITPPSPRSATGLRSGQRRSGSENLGQQPRASSSQSQTSSAFRPPASVHPMPRSASPLSSHFGDGNSMSTSTMYDSQHLGSCPPSYDDSMLFDSIPSRDQYSKRDPLSYYPSGEESEYLEQGNWYFRPTKDMTDDQSVSTLTRSQNYDQLLTIPHTPSAFNTAESPAYQASSSIRSNRGEMSPRIPRI